jgi:hypothetical protein
MPVQASMYQRYGNTDQRWSRAVLPAIVWAIVATVVNAVVWVWAANTALEQSLGWMAIAPFLLLVAAGVVHRSWRVALLAGLFAVGLNILAFAVLAALALEVVHWRA